MADKGCYWYRDRDGFCRLQNRCWEGKPCPKTQREADRAREQLCEELIAVRDGADYTSRSE